MHQHLVVDRSLPGLPEQAAGWLREAQVRTFMRNRHQLSELARLLELLEKRSIPVVVLKGPALACTLYIKSYDLAFSGVVPRLHKYYARRT